MEKLFLLFVLLFVSCEHTTEQPLKANIQGQWYASTQDITISVIQDKEGNLTGTAIKKVKTYNVVGMSHGNNRVFLHFRDPKDDIVDIIFTGELTNNLLQGTIKENRDTVSIVFKRKH